VGGRGKRERGRRGEADSWLGGWCLLCVARGEWERGREGGRGRCGGRENGRERERERERDRPVLSLSIAI